MAGLQHQLFLCIFTVQANSHAPSCIECTLSDKMDNDRQMAIAILLAGFNDLGQSVTPIFLLMEPLFFF